VGFCLLGIRGVGVSLDNTKLVRRQRLVPACLLLAGQGERLACVLPGLLATSRQPTDLAEPGDPAGMTFEGTRADRDADPFLQLCAPLRQAPLERRGKAQTRHDRWQPGPLAGGTTEGQSLVKHPDGVLQVPLRDIEEAEAAVGHERCLPSAFERGEAERLLPMTPALGKGPELAQGPRQPCPGFDPKDDTEGAALPVRRLHVPP
jgi:hypothetical protein